MVSNAKVLANRLNSQKSTGPRTSQGKAAVKHGLLAEQDVITFENEADFDLFRRQLLDELNPVSPMESMLAERIVTLSWRLKRAGRFQNQAIDVLNSEDTSDPLKKLTQSLIFKNLNRPQPTPSASDNHLALGRLVLKDFSDERVLEHLLMHERRIENSLLKMLLEFQRINIVRKLERSGNPLGG